MTQNVKAPIKQVGKKPVKSDFERTPLLERLKAKFINGAFLVNIVWFLFRFLLLIGVSYIILFPFITKIAGSFMSPEDFVDVTVRLISKYPTLEQYKAIITDNGYVQAFFNTLLLSGSCAVIQTFVCSLIGYGLAKFKFKGNGLVFLLIILTLIVPHSTLQFALFMKFRYFDLFGIIGLFTKGEGLRLINSYWPLLIMSMTGLGFKNGLYVFMLRQFYKGIPDELEESAYLDGSGTLRTFLQIIIPLSVPMLITVFMFSFSWQWTDNFYTDLFFMSTGPKLMPSIVKVPSSLNTNFAGSTMYTSAITNTCGLMIIIPLLVIYLFAQRYIMEGIERSGITG